MDCTTCALNIHKYLEKQGMKNVKVNFVTGDVMFDTNEVFSEEKISTGISGLGYSVVNDGLKEPETQNSKLKTFLSTVYNFTPKFIIPLKAKKLFRIFW